MKKLFEFAGNPVPDHLNLFQMNSSSTLPSCHIYMEAQIFSQDSKRMVIHTSAHPHGSDPFDPMHQYLLYDFDNQGDGVKLTHECGVTAPVLSLSGNTFYYFIDDLANHGRIIFKRLNLSTMEREEITRIEKFDSFSPAYFFYPLSTISADGKRIAVATGLKKTDNQKWPEHGLWVIDIDSGNYRLVLHGMEFGNLHLQYCRNIDHCHDIMIQHNHGSRLLRKTEGGKSGVGVSHVAALDKDANFELRKMRKTDDPTQPNTGLGLDLHIVSDDTGKWQTLPVGRDGVEFCQGHQCWRGDSSTVIASTLLFNSPTAATQELIELEPFNGEIHYHNKSAGGRRNILSRKIVPPHFLHFATSCKGDKIVSDYEADNGEWHLYTGELGVFGDEANLQFTLNLGSREKSPWHPHPFLSPDGKKAFFNSSISGQLHPYCLELEKKAKGGIDTTD